MWEAIAKILTNSNALLVLIFLTFFILILIVLTRTGLVEIKTANFRMGADAKERDIIRQQVEWAHTFLMSLPVQIEADNSKYGGYFTKYILEAVYDEVVNWITFNHINIESDYIGIKQAKIKNLVWSLDVDPRYRTKDFEKKIERWTDDLIHKLVKIREVYR